jgi:hypothetical protein
MLVSLRNTFTAKQNSKSLLSGPHRYLLVTETSYTSYVALVPEVTEAWFKVLETHSSSAQTFARESCRLRATRRHRRMSIL